MKKLFKLIAPVAVLAVAIIGLGNAPSLNAAGIPNFQLPFQCNEKWYARTYTNHGNAIDWNAFPSDDGSSVVASAGGTATAGSDNVGGNWVVINHGDGWSSYYGHLQASGKTGAVNRGDVIGKVGQTGTATAAHLHWEQRLNGQAQWPLYVDGSAVTAGTTGTTADPSYISKNCNSAASTIKANKVKKTSNAGIEQVYAATSSDVFESWWQPGGNGIQTSSIIKIAQNNIVDFDKVTLPNGVQKVFTAVPDGIWETWWTPQDGTHHNKIITLANVKKVIADNVVENGQLTHRLYVLASDGPYEYWWQDGGDGIHKQRLSNINDPVAMVKTKTGGVEQLYTATAGAVFESWWQPGQGVQTSPIINISQNDIVDIDKETSPSGIQQLYTATKNNGIWESKWGQGSLTHTKIVNSLTDIRRIEKRTASDGTNQLYAATSGLVQEYWWRPGASGGSTLIVATDIKDIDKTVSGSAQQLYTATGPNVLETWWGNGSIQTAEIASFD